MRKRLPYIIIYTALGVVLLFLTSCVTERVEKRPVYRFAFAPEENNGRNLGKRYSRSERERLPRNHYMGHGKRRSENFIPARLENFSGNPHLIR